jgi:hypothetical protein
MRKSITIQLVLLLAAQVFAVDIDYRIGGHVGWIMPDGKVEEIAQSEGKWVGPTWGVDVSATFYPSWKAMQAWNGAGVGVGFSYWNLTHDLLGQAFAPYAYMDIPLFKSKHFVLGLRPGIGAAFMTKTYRNTVPEGHLFVDVQGANSSIGSVANLYFPEMLYMDFPIAQGWSVGLAGGWYHISNGSLRQPNSGYNLFAAELALRYSPNGAKVGDATYRDNGERNRAKTKRWSVVMAGTASGREVYYKDQQRFFVGSVHAAAYWHAHPIFHLGGGVDVFYDGAYTNRETNFKKTYLQAAQAGDCWRVGVSIQPTFVVGNFTTGVHIGAYVYDPVKELEPYKEASLSPTGRVEKPMFYAYDVLKAGSAGYPDGWLYTEVVLRYHLPWHIFVQAMMKSHITKVEFVSLGIGFYY